MNNIEFEIDDMHAMSPDEMTNDLPDEGTYMKFRYTPTTTYSREDYWRLIRFIQSQAGATHITFGIETLDKYGNPTAEHLHIHLLSKRVTKAQGKDSARVGAVRKAFQRSEYYASGGNNSYSLAAEADVKDPTRFFRYCWKQKGLQVPPERQMLSYLSKDYLPGKFINKDLIPAESSIELEVAKAHEEWNLGVGYNRKIKARKEEPSSCDKLIAYLEDLNQPEMNVKEIMVEMLKYYTERQQPANKNTLQGYLTIYLLKTGKVSYGAMADKFLAGY